MYRYKLNLLLITFSLFFTTGFSPVQAGSLDPLNPEETARALQMAQVANPTTAQRRLSLTPQGIASETELLLIERHVNAKNQTGRLADVYTYDYANNETLLAVVDLDSSQTVSLERQQHLQLPLTQNEIQRASDLIFADHEERSLLEAEYQRITGQPLNSPSQLEVKAFVFLSDSLPEQLNAASSECGLQRCAQILLYTSDSVVFEVSPIVNLSAGIITQNIGF